MAGPTAGGAPPHFYAGPLKYCRWAARNSPAYFWSCVLGAVGPIMVLTVPPILERMGYQRTPPVPLTYPMPVGPRKKLTGYDDE
ncbi:uncharacterized protein GGS22DRAFT_166484 [Annulohypoxylon maeteangense]|uniref:uncharacterized protein n=1 Tax=Annulohypoxylon maeteangense TaxID=1927788 RepID=UPI002007D08C|nr:uncharacterized protein GGS22DRAFT_166484 [Annulohypoxylon maeteangense]KAI0883951.1 hypothetical protein GGS22DRAFT_166484 [Annulohypoxylon maeteangense]